jgi:hypothetical protein
VFQTHSLKIQTPIPIRTATIPTQTIAIRIQTAIPIRTTAIQTLVQTAIPVQRKTRTASL